jgi:alginate O-acetyltransferase complex protein AlgI
LFIFCSAVLFNSLEFLIFFVIVYGLYRVLPFRGQNSLLLIASYFFYGWWDVRFLFLVMLSTAIDFYCGAMIDRGALKRGELGLLCGVVLASAVLFDTLDWSALQVGNGGLGGIAIDWVHLLPPVGDARWWAVAVAVLFGGLAIGLCRYSVGLREKARRQLFLWVSIGANLLILGFFKYVNFFIDNAQSLLAKVGLETGSLYLNVILPVGISFYTFKAISYAVDLYRGKLKAATHFWDFALFWAYFPPLFAGPIDRASELLPQITSPRKITLEQISEGLFLILIGLVKKVAIADGLSVYVNLIYGSSGDISRQSIILATLFYTLQIYCDFCGYSDIARGISKLFGIELRLNFDLPYFSKTPSEFWRRWHMSLSTWLRDYLYIPLGGSRKGEWATYRNLMLTMLLGGFWHGAAWNFILWGGYQGALLCGYKVLGIQDGPAPARAAVEEAGRSQSQLSWLTGLVGDLLARVFFLGLTCYGWLLFRATSWGQVLRFTEALVWDPMPGAFTPPDPTLPVVLGVSLLILYEAIQYVSSQSQIRRRAPIQLKALFYAALILILLMGESNAPAQFIYSQF